jgi:hypothetical protein
VKLITDISIDNEKVLPIAIFDSKNPVNFLMCNQIIGMFKINVYLEQ